MASFAEMLRGEPLSGGVTVPILGPASAAPAKPFQPPLRPGWTTPCVGSVSLPLTYCPDLAPPLAAWGALLNGTLYLKDAGRLRIKESDRLATITAALRVLGAGRDRGAGPAHYQWKARASRRHCGLRQRSPHRHDGGHRRHRLHRAGDTAGRGVCEEVLPGFLGGLPVLGR